MNSGNAIGFVVLGAVMSALPHLAPGLCPATGFDGTSTRAVWLQLMGFLQVALGTGYLANVGFRLALARLAVLRDARATTRAEAPIFVSGGSRVDAS
jgi:hypothetical protein